MASVVISGDTSGSVTLQAPAVSGSTTLTLPATTATLATLTTPSFATTIGVGGATASASGSGISFPATQSASSDANTLDDYEEGTWTPAGNGVTYTSPVGNYTKIGDFVFCTYEFSFPSTASTSAAEIQGLPFAISGSNGARGSGSVTNTTSGVNPVMMAFTGSKTIFRDASNNNLLNVAFSTAYLTGMIVYRT